MTTKVKLSDIVKIAGRVGWKGYTVDDLREDGPWVIGANDITSDNRLDLSKAKHISREKFEESPEIMIEVNDILIVKVGSTIGKVAIVKNDIGEACINPNSVILKNCKINPSYLYYYFVSSAGQAFLKNNSSASAQSALNQTTLKEMLCDIVDRKSQDIIANLLDSINLKILLNNKINAELEATAKTLYDYWFVQFDFPDTNGKPYKTSSGKMVWNMELKREIPEGWEVKPISKVIEIKDGTHDSPKPKVSGYPLITSKNLKVEGLDFENANLISEEDYFSINKRSKVDTGDILFSMIGNIGTIYKVEEKEINFAIKNVALYKTSQNEDYKNFIYMFLKSIDMDRYMKNVISGSIQKFIGLSSLRNSPIFINEDLIKKYNEVTHPIFIKLENSKLENQELSSLRYWLLPMLMNGQVSVGAVEEKLGMVAEEGGIYGN